MEKSADSIPNAAQAPEAAGGESPASVEKLFEGKRVPPWREQLTVRAMVVALVLTVLLSFVIMKLNLTTGVVPSFNVAAGLLGFLFVKTWTKALEKSGLVPHPFTRQENTIIQTCVSAATSVAASGGFDTYLLGMTEIVARQSPQDSDAANIKNLSLPWIFGFLLVVSFVGIFAVVPLRKILVIDLKLPYPSGTATAHLINSFHTPQGAELAKKQVKSLGQFSSFSFLWGFFQWFYIASDGCGFQNFPTFGMKAFDQTFYFNFSPTYVGIGMICPYIVNISMLVGAVLSWGIMWPLIATRKGHWYDANLDESSFKGLEAYKVFIFIAIILGDGLFNFSIVLYHIIRRSYTKYRNKATIGIIDSSKASPSALDNTPADLSYDDQLRARFFLKDQISTRMALGFYIVLAVISAITLPFIFHPLKWYYIIVLYIIAPALTFCNAYGAGLTDMTLAFAYTILAIFIIGSWAGPNHNGVIAGLAAGSVIMNIAMSGCVLMQDFRTGYMTLASPRSMFVGQLVGTLIGCGVSPLVFWVFYKAYPDMGSVGSTYPAPNALVTRNIAILGVEGFSALPKHCLTLCCIFFIGALVINGIKVAGNKYNKKWARFIPIPLAMAVPFYLGAYFAIDMCVGSLILFVWRWRNRSEANNYASAVAAGLICGDGIWTLPESILALAGVKSPICMKFLSRRTNAKVDAFLST